MASWAELITATILTSAVTAHVPEGRYTERMFREAVEHRRDSSPPFVLVTIVDAVTGEQKTGCADVGALAAAISLEMGWTRENPKPDDDEVDRFLVNAQGHQFTFNQARWLAGSGYYSMDRNEKACVLLRRGIPAFRADLTGQIVAGTPGHALPVLPPLDGS